MRSRYLKPDVFLDELLADLVVTARYLFLGLQCAADRDGRLEDRPRRIKGQIFPYDDVDVEELLGQLEGAKFITRYAVDGRKFIQVTHFKRDQRPHSNEADSVIPAPDMAVTCDQGKQDLQPRTEALRSENGELESENGERSEELSRSDARPSPNGYTPEELSADWNATADLTGLRRCRELTSKRRKIASQRLREHSDRAYWLGVIERLGASAFCRGSNERGWRAGIDFLLQPETHVKAMEGLYDDREPVNSGDRKMRKNLDAARRFAEVETAEVTA